MNPEALLLGTLERIAGALEEQVELQRRALRLLKRSGREAASDQEAAHPDPETP